MLVCCKSSERCVYVAGGFNSSHDESELNPTLTAKIQKISSCTCTIIIIIIT